MEEEEGGEGKIHSPALNLVMSTRTILHKKTKFKTMDMKTGTTRTFVYFVSFIQQLEKKKKMKICGNFLTVKKKKKVKSKRLLCYFFSLTVGT